MFTRLATGLVVVEEHLQSIGCEFESQHFLILDGFSNSAVI